MKKLLMIMVMAVGFVLNSYADEWAYVSKIDYGEKSVTVYLNMTNTAKQNYQYVSVKVVPSRNLQGIVEGVKYTTVGPDVPGNYVAIFNCEEGKSMQCKKYDFDVITQDKTPKKK